MADAISAEVLKEILGLLARCGEVPSARAVKELAAAAGMSEQAVKNDYTSAYKSDSNEDDPSD